MSKNTIMQNIVLETLEDLKAENIEVFDLENKSNLLQMIIICTARSPKHAHSISDKVYENIKEKLDIYSNIEGKESSKWILIDMGDIVLHIFNSEARDFYNIKGLL